MPIRCGKPPMHCAGDRQGQGEFGLMASYALINALAGTEVDYLRLPA